MLCNIFFRSVYVSQTYFLDAPLPCTQDYLQAASTPKMHLGGGASYNTKNMVYC